MESVIFFEALVKIADRVIEFARGRIEGRKQLFDRVIEPSFKELLQVHTNYIEMLSQIKVSGKSMGSDLATAKRVQKAKETLRLKRIQFEPVRQKLAVMGRELAHHKLKADEKAFVEALLRYFPTGEPSVPQSSATAVLSYLNSDLKPEQIDLLVEKTLQRHRNAWSDVCTTYAKLEAAVAKER
jgi:hypothetical protein